MERTANTVFSAMQRTLLSNQEPFRISWAALGMSAVSSTTTGGLAAPAATAFLPLVRAALTTPGPPAAVIIAVRRMLAGRVDCV